MAGEELLEQQQPHGKEMHKKPQVGMPPISSTPVNTLADEEEENKEEI
jgi:hypothetical protein